MIEMRKMVEPLLATITHQSDTQTRTIDILTNTINHREQTLATIFESYIDAERENAEERASNMVLTHALESQHGPPSNGWQDTAVGLLSNVVEGMTGTGAEMEPHDSPGEEQLKEWMANDVFFTDTMRRIIKEKDDASKEGSNDG